MYTDELLAKYPIISDQVDRQELKVILNGLEQQLCAGAVGSVVEFGCYAGTTSLFIRRMLDHYRSDAAFHVYDSFEGLPDKAPQDASGAGEQFKTGELAVSKKDFMLNFKKAGLRTPFVHKGWFDQLRPEDVPDGILFAFLDGDYYHSIRDPLRLITTKLTPDAMIFVDDYANEALPGAARATDEWVRANPGYTLRVQASLAVVRRK